MFVGVGVGTFESSSELSKLIGRISLDGFLSLKKK